jgi:hypothetical protein
MGAPGPECDHHTWAANGIAYGNGLFVAAFGWGEEGEGHGLYAGDGSMGGTGFAEVINGSYNGVAYGSGGWVGGSGAPAVSTDDGATFHRIDPALHYDTPRGAFFADVMGGRHVVYADGPTIIVSDDGAETFFAPDSVEGPCGRLGAGGGGVMVMYEADASSGCRSTDGGVTWTGFDFPGTVRSHAVWTGSEIWVFGDGNRYSSSDGMSWETTALSPGGVRFHHLARAEDGTLLGVWSEWGSYYDGSELWRSTDGVNWEQPTASSGVNGHPIRGITAGFAPASACD